MTTHIVIGAGRMGGAMLSGWTKGAKPSVKPADVLIVDPKPSDDFKPLIEKGALEAKRLEYHVATAKYVLLAIKPQSFDAVAPEVAICLPKGCVIISVMAGITMGRLAETFPEQAIVRAMPNTPASIGQGITAFVAGESLTKTQKKHVEKLLGAVGTVLELENEAMIDMVTAISGSGPAYFFHMVEALAGAGQAVGLSEEQAGELAAQTMIGSGALLAQSGQSATELRRGVTSPNGTTQAALDVLMRENGLPKILREAVFAAYRRSQELGKTG